MINMYLYRKLRRISINSAEKNILKKLAVFLKFMWSRFLLVVCKRNHHITESKYEIQWNTYFFF